MREEKNSLITAEYYPRIRRDDIIKDCKYTLSLRNSESYGTGFAIAAASIIKEVTGPQNQEGLYRCVFPEGVSGNLAAFKDGSGFLGTIMDDHGITGQARWIPAEGQSIQFAMDPVTIAVAAAIAGINKKLDSIQKVQEEILQFLHQDKESELEGAVNSLSDILEQYKYNSANELWKGSQLTVVSAIKGKAEHNIIFYRKEITKVLENQKKFSGDRQIDKVQKKLDHNFKYYQLGTYLYAYASFLEVMLGGNFKKEFLEHTEQKMKEYSLQYRFDYSECYERLESVSRSSIQTKIFGGIGTAGRTAGEMISKIPVLSKGPVDEALVAAGRNLKKISDSHTDKVMQEFRNNREVGIQLFIESLDRINTLSNQSVEILFDQNELFICQK